MIWFNTCFLGKLLALKWCFSLCGIYFNQKTFQNTYTHRDLHTSSERATKLKAAINRIQGIFLTDINTHTYINTWTRFLFFFFSAAFFYREWYGEWREYSFVMWFGMAISFIDDDDNEHTFIMPPQKSIDIDSIIYDRKSWIEVFFIVAFTSFTSYTQAHTHTHKVRQMSWPKITQEDKNENRGGKNPYTTRIKTQTHTHTEMRMKCTIIKFEKYEVGWCWCLLLFDSICMCLRVS